MSAPTDIAERHDHAARQSATCDLFADAIRKFGIQQLKAGGNSMRPAIWPGDELQIESADLLELAVGDVVAVRRHSGIVAHRVVARVACPSGVEIITRGDRLHTNDEPVAPGTLLGRVTLVRRGSFRIDPTRAVPVVWRAASAVFEGAIACRRVLSAASHRARSIGPRTALRAS